MKQPHIHASHPQIVRRLRRAEGHLRKIIEMIEAGRPCEQLAQQLQAVEKAIVNAKKTLIHDHIDHCLEHTMKPMPREDRDSIDAFKAITKFL